MPQLRKDHSIPNVTKAQPVPERRPEQTARPEAKKPVLSRANEIVRAIGLRPITGLSGPKIGY
jgi:hypothetical protein